jgi:hypothetical protein
MTEKPRDQPAEAVETYRVIDEVRWGTFVRAPGDTMTPDEVPADVFRELVRLTVVMPDSPEARAKAREVEKAAAEKEEAARAAAEKEEAARAAAEKRAGKPPPPPAGGKPPPATGQK